MLRKARNLSSLQNKANVKEIRKSTIFHSKRDKYIILKDDVDRTPKLLTSKEYRSINEHQVNAINFIIGDSTTALDSDMSISNFGSISSIFESRSSMDISDLDIDPRELRHLLSFHLLFGAGVPVSGEPSLDLSLQIETIEKAESVVSAPVESEEDISVLRYRQRHHAPVIRRDTPKVSDTVVISVRETPTTFLFSQPSHTTALESEEGVLVKADNQYHEYLTLGKGRFRKLTSIQTQTLNTVKKTNVTMAWRIKKKTKSTFLSDWMREVEKEIDNTLALTPGESLPEIKSEIRESESENKMAVPVPINESVVLTAEQQFRKIATSEAFLNSCAKMERLLASNIYCEQQKIFRGLMQQDPFRMDVEFKYSTKLLWSFISDYVNGRTVTGMCWNPLNTDLIAVGYGKYLYHERINGLVCCWSIKNPTQPERKYNFNSPVTAVNFSKHSPNQLGCGFHDGTVIILDISSRTKNIIAQSNRESSPSYEPVWQLVWFHGEDYHQQDQEQIMTSCEDGRISRYRRDTTLNCFPMMRVSRVEGKVKGIDQPRKCRAHDIPVSRNPAALVLCRHPTDPNLYYVGTDEGCIHKCSINYLHHHIEIFLAHNGPVYSMEFSPFCSKIFLTCGADWCVRIWCEGIGEPLLTLKTTMEAVLSATWNPAHATIFASVSGNQLHLWDIRRKMLVPASITLTPSEKKNMLLRFTASGLNLVVGDGNGAVHVYGLEDMPFSPFYQEATLVRAIKKTLGTRPHLLKALKKIGKPFF